VGTPNKEKRKTVGVKQLRNFEKNKKAAKLKTNQQENTFWYAARTFLLPSVPEYLI